MKESLTEKLKAVSDIFLPRQCVVCSKSLNLQERIMCLSCKFDFPDTHFELQSHNRMADFYNERLNEKLPSEAFPYQYAIALMRHRSGSNYTRIPWALKYNGNIKVGKYFAHLLAQKIKKAPWFSDVDLVIPVPLHPLRRWKRGYNQAEVIAKKVAEDLGVRFEAHFLVKKRFTKSQVKVDTRQRSTNIADSFKVNARFKGEHFVHILIVDDVFTTGSTLSECHKIIRATSSNEMVRISVATLACAEN